MYILDQVLGIYVVDRHYVLCFRYLFNDAEVKPFDSAQLASECFGGEMTVSFIQKL